MNRGDILDKAKQLTCGDRNDQYGEPGPQIGLSERMYQMYLDAGGSRYSDAHNGAIHQVFVKLSRIAHGQIGKLDTYMDAAAYAAIAGQMVSDQLEAAEDTAEEMIEEAEERLEESRESLDTLPQLFPPESC